MITLNDHFDGDAPTLRLLPAAPLAERERDAAKKRQQDEVVRQMRAGYTRVEGWQPDSVLVDYTGTERDYRNVMAIPRVTLSRDDLKAMGYTEEPTKADPAFGTSIASHPAVLAEQDATNRRMRAAMDAAALRAGLIISYDHEDDGA